MHRRMITIVYTLTLSTERARALAVVDGALATVHAAFIALVHTCPTAVAYAPAMTAGHAYTIDMLIIRSYQEHDTRSLLSVRSLIYHAPARSLDCLIARSLDRSVCSGCDKVFRPC